MNRKVHDRLVNFVIRCVIGILLLIAFGLAAWILYLIFSSMDQENQFINGILGALGGIFGGLLTLIGVSITLTAQRKQKNQENIEANRALRITYQLVVLNLLDQMRKAFGAELTNTQDPNIIGFLPNKFIVPIETLVKHIKDPLFPTDVDLIFRKVEMIQNLYYDDNGTIKSGVNMWKYKNHVRIIYEDISKLHDRLEKKHMRDEL